jgi:branched-chain amino acid transport system ATP-binding protein
VTPILETRGLTVRYGGSAAVTDADLELHSGDLVAVAGGNGAGKSTLVNAVAGWSRARPTVVGHVYVDGQDISRKSAQRRLRDGVVLVPEGKGIFDSLTVRENIELIRSPRGAVEREFSIDDIYELFPNLRDRSGARGSALSGGERQMVAVARALRAAPRVLILDEPSIGLAPKIVIELLQRIRQLVDRGLSVLLVEQNIRASLEVADRLYLLERGRVVGHGTADEMRGDSRIAEAYLGGMRR